MRCYSAIPFKLLHALGVNLSMCNLQEQCCAWLEFHDGDDICSARLEVLVEDYRGEEHEKC